MPRDEFLTLLGFDPTLTNEQLSLDDLFKACFDIMNNPAWRELSEEKRVSSLQTGNAVMTNMGRPGL